MARGRWLTPAVSPPGTFYARRLLIPQDVDWLAIVKGALLELTYASSFEQISGVTPDDAAAAFLAMFDQFNSEDWTMIGAIIPYATTSLPANTLACDGATYNRVDYPDLYAALHAAFIVDADHFAVPDLRGRAAIGTGAGSGLTSRAMNDNGGAERVTLTLAELPGHNHSEGTATATLINGGLEAPASSAIPSVGATGSAGGGGDHENMQPWRAVGYAIIAR